MAKIITHQTQAAHWHELIILAQKDVKIVLDHEVEAYVVMMLMRHMCRTDLADVVLSLEYLKALELPEKSQNTQIQIVADQCLIHAGLFPDRAMRKSVSTHYFIDLGRSAYAQLMERLSFVMPSLSALYFKLCAEFNAISNVMLNMRPTPILLEMKSHSRVFNGLSTGNDH
jgi:hypothetical protein